MGVLEINKLSSKSFNREDGHFYYMPRITFDELVNTSDNVIVTTACLGGILHNGNDNLKDRFIRFLQENRNRCFLEIQHHNEAFYQVHPEEELFRNHFRAASDDEAYEMFSLSDILEALKEKHGSLLRNVSMVKFGNALVASGVERVHTKLGNRYKLVRVDVGE